MHFRILDQQQVILFRRDRSHDQRQNLSQAEPCVDWTMKFRAWRGAEPQCHSVGVRNRLNGQPTAREEPLHSANHLPPARRRAVTESQCRKHHLVATQMEDAHCILSSRTDDWGDLRIVQLIDFPRAHSLSRKVGQTLKVFCQRIVLDLHGHKTSKQLRVSKLLFTYLDGGNIHGHLRTLSTKPPSVLPVGIHQPDLAFPSPVDLVNHVGHHPQSHRDAIQQQPSRPLVLAYRLL